MWFVVAGSAGVAKLNFGDSQLVICQVRMHPQHHPASAQQGADAALSMGISHFLCQRGATVLLGQDCRRPREKQTHENSKCRLRLPIAFTALILM